MIPRTVRYAVAAAVALARRPSEFVPRLELAADTGVPAQYLAKVMQALTHARLVVAQRGLGGGYRLARPPEQITVAEIIAAVHRADDPEGVAVTRLDADIADLMHQWEGLTLASLAGSDTQRLAEFW